MVTTQPQQDSLSLIPLGGVGDVTKNLYVYEYKDSILIVDCGLGFADASMLGVDLLLPDITYLIKATTAIGGKPAKKKIVGMFLTHGHEDHIGAVPFILPQLEQRFPIYASPLTAAFTNEKLREFGIPQRVESIPFEKGPITVGDFTVSFIRLTHSIPDTANLFIETPIGNFYHGSDFKFDLTPYDGKKADYHKIAELSKKGVLCLLSDCLGAERVGHTPSELAISDKLDEQMRNCKGKFVLTTFASNVSRLNQAIEVAARYNRKVCFAGRSLLKASEVAQNLGYMQMKPNQEIRLDQLRNYRDNQVMLIVAGSQGQENAALTRISEGQHKDIRLSRDDVVVFSSDAIPGNEANIYALIDTLAKIGAKIVYSGNAPGFHVSGHGSSWDIQLMMTLTRPIKLFPIGGNYHHMVAYRKLAEDMGYKSSDVLLPEDGQEMIFTKGQVRFGKKIEVRNVYVDEVSGEELSSYILRDRQKLSESGIVVVMLEISSSNGQIVDGPTIIPRGFIIPDNKDITGQLSSELRKLFGERKGKISSLINARKQVSRITEQIFFRTFRRNPLVLPILIEV